MPEQAENPRGICPFCLSGELRAWFEKQEQEETYTICCCDHCRSAMVWPRPSQESMDAYYQGKGYGMDSLAEALDVDAGHYPDSVQDAKRIIGRIRQYAPGDHFLDVGAGTGFFSREAVQQGFEVTALEPNPNSARSFTQITGFAPLQHVLDGGFSARYQERMDVVLLSQVLEHICDLEQMMEAIAQMLVPGGVAAIAVPHFGSLVSRVQGRKDMYISPPEHLNYFSVQGLDALFERFGFEKVHLETVSKVPKSKIERMLPLLGLGAVGWRLLYGVLKLAEPLNHGMIINAYYRKSLR